MAYTVINFKTKKALKEALKDYHRASEEFNKKPDPIRCYNSGLGPGLSNFTGKIYLDGPHYPAVHTWYAEAWLENGIVVKVK